MADCPENCTTEVCAWILSQRLENLALYLDVEYDGSTYSGAPVDFTAGLESYLDALPKTWEDSPVTISWASGPGNPSGAASYVVNGLPTEWIVTGGPTGSEKWIVQQNSASGWQWRQIS